VREERDIQYADMDLPLAILSDLNAHGQPGTNWRNHGPRLFLPYRSGTLTDVQCTFNGAAETLLHGSIDK